MTLTFVSDDSLKLTEDAEGKHHIGQFLPPEELQKFMATFTAAKNGQQLDKSDYQELKLTEENKGKNFNYIFSLIYFLFFRVQVASKDGLDRRQRIRRDRARYHGTD